MENRAKLFNLARLKRVLEAKLRSEDETVALLDRGVTAARSRLDDAILAHPGFQEVEKARELRCLTQDKSSIGWESGRKFRSRSRDLADRCDIPAMSCVTARSIQTHLSAQDDKSLNTSVKSRPKPDRVGPERFRNEPERGSRRHAREQQGTGINRVRLRRLLSGRTGHGPISLSSRAAGQIRLSRVHGKTPQNSPNRENPERAADPAKEDSCFL